jgi:hypothetical protein
MAPSVVVWPKTERMGDEKTNINTTNTSSAARRFLLLCIAPPLSLKLKHCPIGITIGVLDRENLPYAAKIGRGLILGCAKVTKWGGSAAALGHMANCETTAFQWVKDNRAVAPPLLAVSLGWNLAPQFGWMWHGPPGHDFIRAEPALSLSKGCPCHFTYGCRG